MIGKNDEQIICYSRVQDYVHRPYEMEKWSSYEFLRFSEIRLMSPKRKEQAYKFLLSLNNGLPTCRPPMLFAHKHMNVTTHDVRILSSKEGKTLTIVGGTLPRVDGDDSKVMLVFFYAGGWRTGLELKSPEEEWSAAFQRAMFSDKAREVMQNMHALYECRDERHHLAAKRRQTSHAVFPLSLTTDRVDRVDEDAYVEQQLRGHEIFSSVTINELTQAASEMSTNLRTIHQQMKDMRKLLTTIPDNLTAELSLRTMSSISNNAFEFPSLDRASWKKILTKAREDAVQSRIPKYVYKENRTLPVSLTQNRDGVVEVIEPTSLQVLRSTYQNQKFTSLTPSALMEQVAIDYGLNEDQRRAYGLTCRDILYPTMDRLRLILTGMAGTGKSRVIKALIALLAGRDERHRFVVMAPTGSAAALVHGSTYHSVLAFGHDNKDITDAVRARLRKQLQGVDLFFLDEMSMISCRELCAISKRLS